MWGHVLYLAAALFYLEGTRIIRSDTKIDRSDQCAETYNGV